MKTWKLFTFVLALSLCIISCDNDMENEIIEIEGVTLNISSSELAIGDSLILKAAIQPNDQDPASIQWEGDDKDFLIWQSDNPRVATVSPNGLVKAVGKGTCNIRFICGTFAASCSIVVRDFNKELLLGQWLSSDSSSYYFHYDNTGTFNGDSIKWTFDGMRLNIDKSANDRKTLILVSTEPGKVFYYESNDLNKQTANLKMVARPITKEDLKGAEQIVAGFQGEWLIDVVDLGLNDGVLWSTCNLWADSPEKTGYVLAWGESEPKQSYILDNYKWYDNTNYELTRYKNDDSGEYITLAQEDDAAHALGRRWRTPANQDFVDLCEKCYTVWSKLEGVDGIQFISKQGKYKGNSIFLPLAGLTENYYQSISANDRMMGFYWSSTLSITDDYSAYFLQLSNISEDETKRFYFTGVTAKRFNGACIRPVTTRGVILH